MSESYNCPECGEVLTECIGYDEATDTSYDAVKCPNGCDISD